MGPRTDSLPRRGERPLWTVASHLCVSLPVLPAALSPTLGPSCGIRFQSPQWGGTGLSGPSLLASFLPVALELAGVSAP